MRPRPPCESTLVRRIRPAATAVHRPVDGLSGATYPASVSEKLGRRLIVVLVIACIAGFLTRIALVEPDSTADSLALGLMASSAIGALALSAFLRRRRGQERP
jgi:hypothetical protein